MVGCVNEIGQEAKADNLSGFLQCTALRTMCEDDSDRLKVSAVLRIGIDGFKNINETFGNKYGDRVLREVAKCISYCIGDRYKAFHVVSDEYLIADLTNIEQPAFLDWQPLKWEFVNVTSSILVAVIEIAPPSPIE